VVLFSSLLYFLLAALPTLAAETKVYSLELDGGGPHGTPATLDLTVTDGKFDPFVWGTAYGYNLSQHSGSVSVAESAGDRTRLSARLSIEPDPIAPRNLATYDIVLVRGGNALSGTFAGFFNDRPVTGDVSGVVRDPSVRPVQGHEPLQPGEHPRLVFRKKDLPELRKRMETPEGKAIVSMMTERSPLRDPSQVTDRHASWMAANWGVIHQLTGDAEAAVKARRVIMDEVVTKPMPADRKDMHHASRLLGIALAYDLCHDAWDKEFRVLLAEYIRVSMSELASGAYEGFGMNEKALDPTPWGHRNAIRMSCAGFAAVAIHGDPDSEGRPQRDTARVRSLAERSVEQYVRFGVTGAGTGVEGSLQRDLALANGVLHYMHASKTALGLDFSRANPMLLAGNVLRVRPSQSNALDFGLSSISVQASGLWPLGLGSVPADFAPAMKWCFDRDAGLLGKQHFGLAYPYQAAYALKNYPFDATAKAPGDGLSLFATDADNGHMALRNRWEGADDIVAELYFNTRGLPPIRTKEDDFAAGVLNVSGFGATWVRGFAGASRMNDTMPASVLYAEADGKRMAVGMDLSNLYIHDPPPLYATWRQSRQFTAIKKVQWKRSEIQSFLNPDKFSPVERPVARDAALAATNAGLRAVRHVVVDMSGDCGAPLLCAIVERSSGDISGNWRIPVPRAVAAPGGFAAGKPDEANVAGRIVVPADAKLNGGQIAGKGEYFVVFTLQKGAPPPVTVEDAGMDAKVRVGSRTVSFDGRRVVLGK
jgi:hypothetical protein